MTRAVAGRRALLVLSGSLNPVHTRHVAIMERARRELEQTGWAVLAGFLAPSSDVYVREKLDQDAIPLEQRVQMCRLAVAQTGWIEVCEWGYESGYRTARRLRELRACAHIPGGLTAIEIMGADAAVRLLGRLAEEWEQLAPDERSPWYEGRTVFCVARPGDDARPHSSYLADTVVSSAAEFGVEVIVSVDGESDDHLAGLSSRSVRECVKRSDWATLRERGWLHPDVARYLERVRAVTPAEASPGS